MTSTDPQRPAVRPTRQRRAVASALAGFDDFRSAQEIHDLISQQGDSVGLATVYRALQAMAEAAVKGDQKALTVLHQIAVKSARVLNGLPMALKQHEAKTSEWWPVTLSWVPSWNRVNVLGLPEAGGGDDGGGDAPVREPALLLVTGGR